MYYKIIRGYGVEDYIEINDNELNKACYCFLTKKDAIFSGGAIRGNEIKAIQPDYHREMGWTRGYKLDMFDYAELKNKGVDKKYQLSLEASKSHVQYLLDTKQEHRLNQPIKELDSPAPVFGEISSEIAKRFSVN